MRSAARVIRRPACAGCVPIKVQPRSCARALEGAGHRQIGVWVVTAIAVFTKSVAGIANQTSARIIRTNSHRRLPLQASVSISPNPIIAGGHTPAIAPLTATAFAASADAGAKSDFCVCSTVAVMVTPCRAANAPNSAIACVAALSMLQRDVSTGVPCVLRSGASRVLQDSVQLRDDSDGLAARALSALRSGLQRPPATLWT